MATWRHVAECDMPPSHYPPVESCVLLGRTARGAVRVLERLPTPVDSNGIPDPYETLRLLASTLDANYQLPFQTNVHHQVHYKREYQEPTEKAYRESPSLMMNMPVQLHNLDHKLLIRAPKPPERVMEEYVGEQRAVSLLFKLGSATLRNERLARKIKMSLPQLRPTDRSVALEQLSEAERRANRKRKLYEKTLTRQTLGSMGLLPDAAILDAMGIQSATTYLGKIGGNRFLDFRRASQDFIGRYGIETGAVPGACPDGDDVLLPAA